ncbi:MAG TPA: hypothetical protein VEN29_01110 [Casimicrobiaceae bacterium]|nr:hypothetical protein [Casimicrobiaceae bacterium]
MRTARPGQSRRLLPVPALVETRDTVPDVRIGIDFSGLAVLERLFLRTPVRLLRAGNNVLDLLFYDIHTIPASTRRSLLRWSDPDGSILVVHPGNGEKREVAHFEHVDDFLASAYAKRLDVVAIAGVGSSALGTAALAANVADALKCPVIGIVSGYGLADAVAEGLVGWFVLRPSNRLRQLVDAWFAPLTPALRRISTDTQPNADPHRLVAYVRGFPETDCLDSLLSLPNSRVAIMVGHSKGNLSIATALDNLTQEQWEKLCPRLKVTTLSALVELPASLAGVQQFMGMLDSFGLMNSILPQATVLVPWATHTLNTCLPFHLAARYALEQGAPAGVESGVSLPPPAAKFSGSWFDPLRLVSDWMDLCTGAAIAVEAAMEESTRSIRQGIDQAARSFGGH